MGRFKPFAACVFPAVFAFALSGIYAIVDGFFVGRSIGDTGLSAINIAYPVTALIQAAGTGTGMGRSGYVFRSSGRKEGQRGGEFYEGRLFLSCPYRHSAYSHFISLNRPSAVPYGSRWRADEARTGISVRYCSGFCFSGLWNRRCTADPQSGKIGTGHVLYDRRFCD